jgi:hypothetical protein
VHVKNIELAIRQEFAPVAVENLDSDVVRIWVSMNSTTDEIEAACNHAGLAPHHVNLATALWNNNNFDRDFDHELGYVLVRPTEAP